MSEPIDLDAIRVESEVVKNPGWNPQNARDWAIMLANNSLALLVEVERLTRIVNGYDRTPAEQRAADAEAEVERLRAENAGLREREARRHSKFSQVQPRVSMLEILGCADDVPESHDPADCPVCRHALGLPEPATLVLSPEIWCDVCGAWHVPTSCSAANADETPRTGPMAANGAEMAHGDTSDLQGIVDRIRDIKTVLGDDAGEGQS